MAQRQIKPSMIEMLPFIGLKKGKSRQCYWRSVKSTGDDMQDQALGSQLAFLTLQAVKAENFAPLLGWIVIDMIENKCPDHIVVGFFQTVADVSLGNHRIPAADIQLAIPTLPRD